MSLSSVEQAVLLDLHVLQELIHKYQLMFAQHVIHHVLLVLSLSITALLALLVCIICQMFAIQHAQLDTSITIPQVYVHYAILNALLVLERPLFVQHAQPLGLIKHF